MFRLFSKFIFWLIGWKITGSTLDPKIIKKSIFIAIPHTSNWDFPLGIMARSIIRFKITYMMKSTMFKPPFGWFFRMMNGMPVERSKSTNFVDAAIKLYNSKDSLHTVIAPEGTRKKVDKLKTGFYYIAKGANIPMIFAAFDFGKKEVRFSDPYLPTDDKEKDFQVLEDFFKGVSGKFPKQSWSITNFEH